MENKIQDLLINLKDSSTLKDAEFCESLYYFSKNENKFIKAFRSFENHEARIEVFKQLFQFLPITEKIIKLILEKKIFDIDIFYEKVEVDNITNYFSKTTKFCKKLDKISLNPDILKKDITREENELNKLIKINNNLQNKKSEINDIKKKNEELKLQIINENISSEENFKIDKLLEKVKRFNEKLKSLGGDHE